MSSLKTRLLASSGHSLAPKQTRRSTLRCREFLAKSKTASYGETAINRHQRQHEHQDELAEHSCNPLSTTIRHLGPPCCHWPPAQTSMVKPLRCAVGKNELRCAVGKTEWGCVLPVNAARAAVSQYSKIDGKLSKLTECTSTKQTLLLCNLSLCCLQAVNGRSRTYPNYYALAESEAATIM